MDNSINYKGQDVPIQEFLKCVTPEQADKIIKLLTTCKNHQQAINCVEGVFRVLPLTFPKTIS